ncbi:hypothetical protein AMATHDRAFT_153119 [Amanita thiersii Skay4041]|uniref:CUE domain-containing protein n=1 Tax=Amanita thiersii Skay4041 TaxID=703135 RepID=A0A2A9NFK8_9AGAR|nr:hypothetical protein AMATHDRAFT_153119 [Amanita thiersii Skay4041]
MGEIVNVLVAFAVIVFFFRWIASGVCSSAERSAADTLGFRPRNVTQDMAIVDTISNMFPDVPIDNIRYDLMRTGNIELTTNKILERGYLDAPPPAYYTVHPRQNNTSNSTRPPPGSGFSTGMHNKAQESLINRYSLQERVASAEVVPEEDIGGKAVWEDTPERREASLRERKARMILAARQ